jgi:hypothetical protein
MKPITNWFSAFWEAEDADLTKATLVFLVTDVSLSTTSIVNRLVIVLTFSVSILLSLDYCLSCMRLVQSPHICVSQPLEFFILCKYCNGLSRAH